MDAKRLSALLIPVLSSHGLELDAVEVQPAGKRTLVRVVVDGDGPTGRGPDLDDIAEATKAVSVALDTAEAASAVGGGAYTLEVTSRGVGRPLQQPQHWRRNRGRLVEVHRRDAEPVTGRIGSSDDDGAALDVDGAEQRVAYADVTKALVQIEFNRRTETDETDGTDEEG